jgi:hypothetical protein
MEEEEKRRELTGLLSDTYNTEVIRLIICVFADNSGQQP